MNRRCPPWAAALLPAAAAQARNAYPNRPVTRAVPFPPRGGTETGARIEPGGVPRPNAAAQFAPTIDADRRPYARATRETRQAMADRVFDNLKSFFATGQLKSAAPLA